MRRSHVRYRITTYHKTQSLWWVRHLNKFVNWYDIPRNDEGMLIYSITNTVHAKTLKKARKIISRLLLEYPEQKVTLDKRVFDRTKKWPRGKEVVYIYGPIK